MTTLRIGTRGSRLALWQAGWVADRLRTFYPDLTIEIITIQTKGDRLLDVSLSKLDNKGFFTDEIESSLFDGSIDLAVHSLKDLPTQLPQGLEIGAYCKREDPRDAFISKDGTTLESLPPQSRIGTSSLRRVAQVLNTRPDLVCVDIRGNVDTRFRKLEESPELDGIILAAAGVIRMGWQERITHYLDEEVFLPAPGQGVVAVEIASNRDDIRAVVGALNHEPSEYEARAERGFLQALEGGCQVPIGARAVSLQHKQELYRSELHGSELHDSKLPGIKMQGIVASLDGSSIVRVQVEGSVACPEELGFRGAERALEEGAAEILAELTYTKDRGGQRLEQTKAGADNE